MREAMVAKVKPVKAAAYDYYRMERRVTRSIAFDDFGDDACQVCGINCAGCPGKTNHGNRVQCVSINFLAAITVCLFILIS
jgi:hypothetical protein